MPANPSSLTVIRHEQFLTRFVSRGWLHAVRDDRYEQEAVDYGLRAGWLRKEGNEAHFTPRGRRAVA